MALLRAATVRREPAVGDQLSAQSGTVIGPGQMRVDVREQGALPHPAERTSEFGT
jgi:hypothetical protein